MDASSSSSASRSVRTENTHSGRAPRTGDKEKLDDKPKTPSHRSATRYKEKFQALREKYDQVTATHDSYQRDLDIANDKVKKLQAENDLLLDAMQLAASSQPTLFKYTLPPTISSQQSFDLYPTALPDRLPVNPIPHSNPNPNSGIPRGAHFSPHPTHMNGNGNSNGNTNGVSRHRPVERDGPPIEFVAHDVNGRENRVS